MNKKYSRILVANRGDSAVRIIRACKELGIETVAIYSKADRGVLHTRLADYAVCIGDVKCTDSYLNSYNILAVANKYKVDAIHPGIGFFSESSRFAQLCRECEIDFIGPDSELIYKLGNKIEAKKIAKSCNVPVIGDNSYDVRTKEECISLISTMGYPIILKAANGGGGKGIRVVEEEKDLLSAYDICLKESKQYFGDSTILLEKYIEKAKHVEVQIIADQYGNVIQLGDRECSILRSNQKLIEETRCCTLSDKTRNEMYQCAIEICKNIGYVGVGTIEFLVEEDESFYFMEMNTRLQVEHTISELLTGVDLVKEQIQIAQGMELSYKQQDIEFHGYALQCRILAEYYTDKFIPDSGKILRFDMPGGFGVRVDSAYEVGNTVTTYNDSLLCKICCHGKSKLEAIKKMVRSLEEMQIEGIRTNKNVLIEILKNPRFLTGEYTTTFLQEDGWNLI